MIHISISQNTAKMDRKTIKKKNYCGKYVEQNDVVFMNKKSTYKLVRK